MKQQECIRLGGKERNWNTNCLWRMLHISIKASYLFVIQFYLAWEDYLSTGIIGWTMYVIPLKLIRKNFELSIRVRTFIRYEKHQPECRWAQLTVNFLIFPWDKNWSLLVNPTLLTRLDQFIVQMGVLLQSVIFVTDKWLCLGNKENFGKSLRNSEPCSLITMSTLGSRLVLAPYQPVSFFRSSLSHLLSGDNNMFLADLLWRVSEMTDMK